MNKKYILLFIGAIVVFIIFIAVIFLQQNSSQQEVQQPSTLQSQNPANLQRQQTNLSRNQNVAVPTITLAPPASTPNAAAKQFYTYYFASLENPLADGAYKNNPYLSQDFKDVLGALYYNGNSPIFCLQNKRANITVGKEKQYYYNNQFLTQEIISDATTGKDLYQITLENVGGKWLIFDVNCFY